MASFEFKSESKAVLVEYVNEILLNGDDEFRSIDQFKLDKAVQTDEIPNTQPEEDSDYDSELDEEYDSEEDSEYDLELEPEKKPEVFRSFKKYSLLDIILFTIFGFIVGFMMSAKSRRSTSDVTENTSPTSFNPYMDQYTSLESACGLYSEPNQQLMDKNEEMRNELNWLKMDNMKLEQQLTELKKYKLSSSVSNVDGECNGYKDKIAELEHDLGECHVEWGSCEQLGRQKDKLDEIRVEEIGKQKKKFSLCNDQLRRYKQEAKKNKRR